MDSKVRNADRSIFPAGESVSMNLGRLGDFVGFRLRRVQNQLSRDFAAATWRPRAVR